MREAIHLDREPRDLGVVRDTILHPPVYYEISLNNRKDLPPKFIIRPKSGEMYGSIDPKTMNLAIYHTEIWTALIRFTAALSSGTDGAEEMKKRLDYLRSVWDREWPYIEKTMIHELTHFDDFTNNPALFAGAEAQRKKLYDVATELRAKMKSGTADSEALALKYDDALDQFYFSSNHEYNAFTTEFLYHTLSLIAKDPETFRGTEDFFDFWTTYVQGSRSEQLYDRFDERHKKKFWDRMEELYDELKADMK
jgi:hypothetical protein